MARNRVIYQSEAVYIGTTGAAPTESLRRVQSCNYNFSISRQDINQYGELASIDRLIVEEPTVSVDLSYYFEPTGHNESGLGFKTDGNTGTGQTTNQHMLTEIISENANFNEKNLYIVTSSPGIDANNTGDMSVTGVNSQGTDLKNLEGVIAIGNCFVNSYSLEAAVGSIPTVSCSLEGQNIIFTGSANGLSSTQTVQNPAVSLVDGSEETGRFTLPSGAGVFDSDKEIAAVRPGDITFVMQRGEGSTDDNPAVGLSESDLKVQSVSTSMTINREPIRKLGSKFAFTREISFPITCTMSVNAIVGDLEGGKLFEFLADCGDRSVYNCTLGLKGIKRGGSCESKTANIVLQKAKLDSQNISSSIGPNKTVTLELSAQIGLGSGLVFAKA